MKPTLKLTELELMELGDEPGDGQTKCPVCKEPLESHPKGARAMVNVICYDFSTGESLWEADDLEVHGECYQNLLPQPGQDIPDWMVLWLNDYRDNIRFISVEGKLHIRVDVPQGSWTVIKVEYVNDWELTGGLNEY